MANIIVEGTYNIKNVNFRVADEIFYHRDKHVMAEIDDMLRN